jgi:formylglycine-generating enzyme required for sulfatase activity
MYIDASHPATVSNFMLDRFEVTVGRFRKFVEANGGTQMNLPVTGAGAHAKITNSGWDASWNGNLVSDPATLSAALQCNSMFQTWTAAPGANETLPISCVTWYEALAFCIWDGGYLPTEAEWNYTAAGGNEQRAYPWSAPAGSLSIDCSFANYYDGNPCVNPPNGAASRVGSTSPKGDGKWGQADLAGNVWEWTLDWYQTPYTSSCEDCANLTPGTERVFRGADFNHTALYLRGAYRYLGAPESRDYYLGIRCARPGN